ncbi:NUDIX hydrolase [Leucobacter sp. G161]|uniref:NUDIX hydrolase n=1 Tax=Leucobacter sp. G161 TaxID=663704 RepID=UPI0009FA59F7
MDLRVAAYAVIERRGKILLTHWRRGHLHGWTLPGGGLEAGEDPKDAVVREVLEETGLNARVGKLLGVDSRVMVREEVPEGTDPEMHTIRIVYRATVQDGPLQNEVDGSSDEARWVSLKDVNSLKTLSLVQTGLRMAGIARRGNSGSGRGGQGRSGGAKSGGAKQGAQKPNSAKGGGAQSGGTPKASATRSSSGRSKSRGASRPARKAGED